MKSHTLQANKRTELGRKVKALRSSGSIPATVYGKKAENMSLTVDGSEFLKVYREAGETGLVELSVDGKALPVLIHIVQKDPITGEVLHVEFHQVDLKEKVKTNVPLVLVGEAPAVAQKIGVLLSVLSEVEVEALPAELPEKIEVDVAGLAELNQELKVSDLHAPMGVALLSEPTLTVVKVSPLVSKEAEEQAAAEAAEAAAAAPAEGEAATPEKTEGEAAKPEAPAPETK